MTQLTLKQFDEDELYLAYYADIVFDIDFEEVHRESIFLKMGDW